MNIAQISRCTNSSFLFNTIEETREPLLQRFVHGATQKQSDDPVGRGWMGKGVVGE
jgi:hypothetical protein